jgi:meiotic recombination protein DMC1
LAERQQHLGQFLRLAHKLSEEFNFAVLMTNQMTSDPGGGMTFVSDPKKPVRSCAHISHPILYATLCISA